jgi:hypothetical protein
LTEPGRIYVIGDLIILAAAAAGSLGAEIIVVGMSD